MSDRNILFSIITPTYNRAGLVTKSIESVLGQTYFNFEMIVVDDGSTDNTEAVVKTYLSDPRIKYFKIKNSERSAARNFGVKQSGGEYVTFLDSDDIFLPWHLSTAAKKISEFGRPPAFHLGYEVLHPDGKVDLVTHLPSPINDKLLEGNFLSINVFLLREVAIRNPFDSDLSLSEDYELWMRIAARHPILVFPEITSRVINHLGRSLFKIETAELIKQKFLVDKKLKADEKFMEFYGNRINIFEANRDLFLALHLAIGNSRWMAFRSLIHAILINPSIVLQYRFVVALKKIVLW